MKTLLYIILLLPELLHAQGFIAKSAGTGTWKGVGIPGMVMRFKQPVSNIAPTANAGSNQTITLPANTATLTGSGTGNGGATISSYAWSQTSGTAATISSSSSATTGITGLTTAGVRVFQLLVTDNHSLTATSSVNVTVNAAPSGKDTAFFNLDLTETITAANWANVTGDPNLAVRTATINGISITTGATSRWFPYTNAGCNCSAFTDNGNASSTYAPTQVVKEDWFSFNAGVSNQDLYADGAWKFQISNLKPGHTYNFTLSGSLGAGFSGFTASTEYRVQGTATVGPTTINCTTNTASVATITITADGSGHAFVYVNAASGNDMGVIDHIKIIEP